MNFKRDLVILGLIMVVGLAGGLFYSGFHLSSDGPLMLGQSTSIGGVTLKPIQVVEDSRCPEGAECIWAGTVKVSTEVGGQTATLELGKPEVIDGKEVTLTEVGNKDNYTFKYTVIDAPAAGSSGGCYVGGCSGQICSDQPDAVSTCEYTPAYACYKTAKCERQASGQCGWTQTAELQMCLNNAQSAR